VALKRTGFGVLDFEVVLKTASYVASSQYVLEVTSHCLCTCTQLCKPLANDFVDDALMNTVLSVNEPLRQLVSVAFRFLPRDAYA